MLIRNMAMERRQKENEKTIEIVKKRGGEGTKERKLRKES